jgi:hypothetical protein
VRLEVRALPDDRVVEDPRVPNRDRGPPLTERRPAAAHHRSECALQIVDRPGEPEVALVHALAHRGRVAGEQVQDLALEPGLVLVVWPPGDQRAER